MKLPNNSPQRLRILFTEGSSSSARQALYGLGSYHTVDILDSSTLCQCRFSRFVRRWYRCPSFSREPKNYLKFLMERIISGDYDVVFPTHEQVFLLAKFRNILRRYVALAVPSFEALDRLMSKANFVRCLDEVGLHYPSTQIVRSQTELLSTSQFPCWVKLDYCTAGEGVRFVCDHAQLVRVANEFAQSGWLDGRAEILIQQPARGLKGGTVGIFQQGRLIAAHSCQTRAFGVGGSSMAQLSVAQPQAVELMERLGRHLTWHGAMGLEHFCDPETGRIEWIECNPRIGETFNALRSGINLCELLVRVSLDEPVERQPPSVSGIRTHQGFLAITAKAMQGASRRELISELLQSARGRGMYESSEDEFTRPCEDWLSVFPYLGVISLLLARPRVAQWLVTKTVQNYSLNRSAADEIRGLTEADLFLPNNTARSIRAREEPSAGSV